MDIEDCELAVGMSFEIDQRLAAHVHDLRLWSRAVSASEIARGRKVRLALCINDLKMGK